jgi:predicted small secreted protein
MLGRERTRRLAQAAFLAVATLGLAACNGGLEGEGERINRGVKDDVRGTRDFLRDRGITIDTRLPER